MLKNMAACVGGGRSVASLMLPLPSQSCCCCCSSVSSGTPKKSIATPPAASCSSSGRFLFHGFLASPFFETYGVLRDERRRNWPTAGLEFERERRRIGLRVRAGGQDEDSRPPVYSTDTKIRSEVISPFRSVRMFFYAAFAASGTIGAVVALSRLAAALAHAQPAADVAKDLAIDLGAVALFALLYRSDARAREASLARLSREEMLSALRVELAAGERRRAVSLQQLRGAARVVILAGSGEFVREAMRRGEPYRGALQERGVLVVPYSSDGEFSPWDAATGMRERQQQGEEGAVAVQQQQRWTASPVYTSEWAKWLSAQKKLANVAEDVPVYISLRLDGRVRGSGVGYPPWQKLSVQLPPMAGLWKGPLDGMDGRV